MGDPDHPFDGEPAAAPIAAAALALARAKLKPPLRRRPVWPLVGAAGLAAAGALTFAAVVILGPPMAATRGAQVDVNPWVR